MKAKYTILSAFLFTAGIYFTSCNGKKEKTDSVQSTTTSAEPLVPDTALYGRLGEGTGMSCIEFITDQGDTLTLNKINETTGNAGVLLGGTEHYNDPLTITTDATQESILTLVNLRTLTRKWQNPASQNTLKLENNGKASATCNGKTYNQWRMWNARLLLGNTTSKADKQECDTFEIRELNQDSLVIAYKDSTFTFYSKQTD